MKREIVKIDRELCNGCGDCIPNCHEGALQMIDGKATLVSELMCDGLGACLGYCPVGAITIEVREAEAYNETATIKEILKNGRNVVLAHLKHLKEHGEVEYLREAVTYLRSVQDTLSFDLTQVTAEVHGTPSAHKPFTEPKKIIPAKSHGGGACGCPGSREVSFAPVSRATEAVDSPSELRQWPVQMHLINPAAGYFKNADVVIAADCVAFSLGDFHSKYLRGKSLAIACPKLDDGQDSYLEKIRAMIDVAEVNTITVMIMEVPCCGGLLQMVKRAAEIAIRKVPVKAVVVSIKGEIISESWV